MEKRRAFGCLIPLEATGGRLNDATRGVPKRPVIRVRRIALLLALTALPIALIMQTASAQHAAASGSRPGGATLAGTQSYQPLAELEALGQGTPGSVGVPVLRRHGMPMVGQPGMAFSIAGGLPFASAQIMIGPGVDPVPLPAYGAVLFPAQPLSRLTVGPLDLRGASARLSAGPAETSTALFGQEFSIQALVIDPGATGGVAFTAAWRLRFGVGSAAGALYPASVYLIHEVPFTNVHEVLAAGDLDGNGRADLVTALRIGGVDQLRVLRQLVDGSLARLLPIRPAGTSAWTCDLPTSISMVGSMPSWRTPATCWHRP